MKKTAFLLALLLMLSAFASCSDNTPEPLTPEGSPVGNLSEQTEVQTEPEEETRPPHHVPESDFGGADFVVAYPAWAFLPSRLVHTEHGRE